MIFSKKQRHESEHSLSLFNSICIIATFLIILPLKTTFDSQIVNLTSFPVYLFLQSHFIWIEGVLAWILVPWKGVYFFYSLVVLMNFSVNNFATSVPTLSIIAAIGTSTVTAVL